MSFLLDWINMRRGGPHDPANRDKDAPAPPADPWLDLEQRLAAQITHDEIAGRLSAQSAAGARERLLWLFSYIRARLQ